MILICLAKSILKLVFIIVTKHLIFGLIIQLELVFLSVQLELLQIISLKDVFKFVLLVNCIMEIHQLVIVFLSVLSTPSYMLII